MLPSPVRAHLSGLCSSTPLLGLLLLFFAPPIPGYCRYHSRGLEVILQSDRSGLSKAQRIFLKSQHTSDRMILLISVQRPSKSEVNGRRGEEVVDILHQERALRDKFVRKTLKMSNG